MTVARTALAEIETEVAEHAEMAEMVVWMTRDPVRHGGWPKRDS
jgi:hypothetical protein